MRQTIIKVINYEILMKKYFIQKVLFGISAFIFVAGMASYIAFTSLEGETEANYDPNNPFDLFADYVTWASSTTQVSPTAAEWLHTMVPNTSTPTTFADANGDGLADVLLHQEPASGADVYGILLNNGDLTFDLAYKCVSESGTFYGDCSQ